MILVTVALIAGMLTALAPCVLPVLPVLLGTAAMKRKRYDAFVVILSLCLSILLFTFLLKVTTVFITLPENTWIYLSGSIIALYGIALMFPQLEQMFSLRAKGTNLFLERGIHSQSYTGDVLVGVALGPVFATCSPTYFFILASVLPASAVKGSLAIVAYIVGLALMLILIAQLGERLMQRFRSINFALMKRLIGILFVVLGLLIATGVERKIESRLYDMSPVDLLRIEYHFLKYIPAS